MINVSLNGEVRELPKEIDLKTMVDLFSFPDKRIAVEINEMVVRRGDWSETIIKDGDRIEIIHFVGGG